MKSFCLDFDLYDPKSFNNSDVKAVATQLMSLQMHTVFGNVSFDHTGPDRVGFGAERAERNSGSQKRGRDSEYVLLYVHPLHN